VIIVDIMAEAISSQSGTEIVQPLAGRPPARRHADGTQMESTAGAQAYAMLDPAAD
jgi:hypothetical protein